jgi:hypothetical protein
MSWKQIVGLVVLCAIVLVPLWPWRRKRKKPGGPDHYDPLTGGGYAGGQDTGFGHGGGGHGGDGGH